MAREFIKPWELLRPLQSRFPSNKQILVLPAADSRTVAVIKGNHSSPFTGADTAVVLGFLREIGCSAAPFLEFCDVLS